MVHHWTRNGPTNPSGRDVVWLYIESILAP